jgi:thiosulfate dehydrogenase (quinone) large subunit
MLKTIEKGTVMATINENRKGYQGEGAVRATIAPDTADRSGVYAGYVWAVTRLALGWVFLWAFLDKTFGLGNETASEAAWVNGGSPTEGFLANAPTGPFKDIYNDIAGAAWADWLFMIGLAALGVALIAGIGMRIAAVAGTVLLVLMWAAVLPPDNNPFIDDHLIYALVLVGLALINAGDVLGFGRWWSRTELVGRYPILR